jgi:transcriptional regulator with XRE-family HTH domain
MKIKKELRTKLLRVKGIIRDDKIKLNDKIKSTRNVRTWKRAITMRQNGMTYAEIARVLGVSEKRAAIITGRASVLRVNPSQEQKDLIISLRREGKTIHQIIIKTKIPFKTILSVIESYEQETGETVFTRKPYKRQTRRKKRAVKSKVIDHDNLEREADAAINNVAVKLSSERARLKITLQDYSIMCGLSKQTISDVERGKKNPSLITLAKMAAGLDKELKFSLEEKNRPDHKKTLSKIRQEWQCLQDGNDIGVDVASIRLKLGCSREEFAESLGVEVEVVDKIERSSIKRLPKPLRQLLLFMHLRLDLNYEHEE